MGAATALAFALEHPERVAALVQLTPAFEGAAYEDAEGLACWDSLADGLERGGVEGFMRGLRAEIKGRFAESIERLTRQRLERHVDPVELAKPVRAVPRSSAFDGLERLEELQVPTLVIGSRDEADPGHPLRRGRGVRTAHSRLRNSSSRSRASPRSHGGAHTSRGRSPRFADGMAGPDQPLS